MSVMKERQKKIISLLNNNRELGIAAFIKELSASEATIRRDLSYLEEEGIIIRTIGGARLKDTPSLVVRTFEERAEKNRKEKELIAAAAAKLVEPGSVVAIDSGTTAWRVAALLKGIKPLTVITTALAVIEEIGSCEDYTIFCIGGQFRRENLDFIGGNVIEELNKVHVDIAFLGADSLIIPGKGLFANDYFTSLVSKALSSCCDRCVVVMDHSKINAQGAFLALPSQNIDVVVTDSGLNETSKSLMEDEPFEMIVV
jgi:DeoR/GlpR family transcriptional regulator of sugar metabolism